MNELVGGVVECNKARQDVGGPRGINFEPQDQDHLQFPEVNILEYMD